MIYFSHRRRFLYHSLRQSTVIKLCILSILTGIFYFAGFTSNQIDSLEVLKNGKNDLNVLDDSTDIEDWLSIKKAKDQDFEPGIENSYIRINPRLFDFMIYHLRNTPYPGVENYTLYTMARKNLKPLSGVKPLRPDFGPVINDVTSFQYPIQIKPCFHSDETGKNTVFVAIVSAPEYFTKREIARQTWLPYLMNSTKIISEFIPVGIAFVLGLTNNPTVQRQIEEESQKFGDILQMDIIDDYYNLTQKSIGIVNWVNSYCSSVDYVLKLDDDTYMNVRNMESFVVNLNSSEFATYGGYSASLSEREGKFNISYEEWPWTNYPTYLSGNTVFLSGKTIGSLLAAAQTVPFLPFEDSYLHGVCSEKAGVQRRHSDCVKVDAFAKNPCDIYSTLSFLTDTTEEMMDYHLATEDFYKNITQCVIFLDGVNRTVNPSERVTFAYQVIGS